MKFHHLNALHAVVHAGGIRAAARALGVTQGAVTKAVRELEDDVGTSLIIRSARGVTLTSSGQQLAERANLIVSQMHAAQNDLCQLRNGSGGRLSIGVSASIMETVLPKVAAQFRSRMPGVRLRIAEATLPASIADLRDGTIDFAIVGASGKLVESDLVSEMLLTIPKHVVGRIGHPLASATSIRALADATWILPEDPGIERDPMHIVFAQAGIAAPSNIIECGALHAAVALVTNSDMLSALPAVLLDVEHFRQRLVRFEIAEALPPSCYALVRRAGVPLSPAARLATELLTKACGSLERSL
jgi:LysR family transcriptional regulator, regulator of abg operon